MEQKRMQEAKMNRAYPAGMKWTKQRKAVYDILEQANEPLSAVQIYNRLEKSEQEAFAVSTVYRILTAFEEQHFVTKTTWIGDGTVVYELNRGGHTHYAVCLECHKRIPLEHCPFAHLHLEQAPLSFSSVPELISILSYPKHNLYS